MAVADALLTAPEGGPLPREEEVLLREAVAGIAAGFGHEYFARISAAHENATELWDALAAGGYTGANIPEQWGGGGLGMSGLAAVTEEVAAAGCPLIMLIISPAIAGSVLARHASEEQKERWLRPIGECTGKIAFAITEPDAGSNSHRISTTARPDGDGWRLTGAKTFISGIDETSAMLVVARTGFDEERGRARLSLFVVDCEAPGVERHEIPMTFEMPDKQFTVFFDDVFVDADRLIGHEGTGLRAVFDGLNPERMIIAATSAGIGRYAIRKAVEYACERRVWDVPIGAHQGLAHPLAEAKIQLDLARLAIQRAAALYDAGLDAGEASNMAKFAAAEASIRCVDVAIEVHGGSGFSREVGLGDMLGLARLFKTVPISREMILNHIAEHSLGLPKSY
jgi:alkylation response protein AidB-like acyl-CoA dehydrogenase